jgi:hypothetical protein
MRTFSAVLSLVLVSAGVLTFALGGGEGGGPLDPPPPVNTEFAGVLLRLDLGADALAAAGVTSAQVPALVAAIEQGYSPASLRSRDEAFIAAKQASEHLWRLVQSGQGSAEDVSALRTAEAALASATSARVTYLAGLRGAALGTVSASQAALVERIRANRAWGLPTHYLVKDRSEAEWVRLRDSLASKRISAEDEEETFDASARSHLAAVDAESEIASAKVDLDSTLAAVQTAWNLAAQ